MSVGAVIVHFETPSELSDCLTSLKEQPITQTVVFDNSRTEQARDQTRLLCKEHEVSMFPSSHNVGFAAGCNRAVAQLSSEVDYLLFVNPDAQLHEGTVAALLSYIAQEPTVGAVNPVIYLPDSQVWFSGGKLIRRLARLIQYSKAPNTSEPLNTDWVNGCVLLARRAAFEQVRGFDERYFLYWEDVVLSLRLREAGWHLAVVPEAKATHLRGEGASAEAISLVQLEHSMRSRLQFVRRELSMDERATALPYTAVNFVRLVMRGRRGQASLVSGFKAACRGIRGVAS